MSKSTAFCLSQISRIIAARAFTKPNEVEWKNVGLSSVTIEDAINREREKKIGNNNNEIEKALPT
jgi:hypothetical protein